MRRRTFIRSSIALGAGLGSLSAFLAVAAPRHIGVMLVGFPQESKDVQQFRQGMRDAGYVEGRDVVFEWKAAAGDYAKVDALASDLVNAKVDVIVVDSTVAVQALARKTTSVPLVMAIVADPLGSGLVPRLSRPGGNITGMSQMIAELHAKRLQLLQEVVPGLKRVGLLWNAATQWHARVVEGLKAVAPGMGIKLTIAGSRMPAEFEAAFADFTRASVQALYVIEDAVFFANRAALLRLAMKSRLPSTFGAREFADEGALMSYGTDLGSLWYRAAGYVDKILKGAKPGDLPVEQPTKFEFVVNLKAAKAIGIAIPEAVLLRADEVIR